MSATERASYAASCALGHSQSAAVATAAAGGGPLCAMALDRYSNWPLSLAPCEAAGAGGGAGWVMCWEGEVQGGE